MNDQHRVTAYVLLDEQPVRPPIPHALEHRPTIAGLVVPWVNVQLADGGIDFRSRHNSRWETCWRKGICQICAKPLESPMVLLGGQQQLDTYFDEAPVHPACASYVTKACPMIAGRMTHYATGQPLADRKRGQKCAKPGCDCEGWVPHNGQHRNPNEPPKPAHPWYAVWADDYSLAVNNAGELMGGVPDLIRRTRLISTPGEPSL